MGGTGRAEDVCSPPVSDLHGIASNSSRRAVNQYALSGGQARVIKKRLPCSQRRERKSGGLRMRQSCRFWRQVVGPGDDVLGSRAVPPEVCESIHGFTGLRDCDTGANGLHHTRDVMPRNGWDPIRAVARGVCTRPSQFSRSDGTSADTDERVACRRRRLGRFFVDELFRAAFSMHSYCLHD